MKTDEPRRSQNSFIMFLRSFWSFITYPIVYIIQKLTPQSGLPSTKSNEDNELIRNISYSKIQDNEEQPEIETLLPENNVDEQNEDVQRCTLIFLGLAGAGKTATLTNLLGNRSQTPLEDPKSLKFSTFSETIRSKRSLANLTVVDTPGLSYGQSTETDAEIIVPLNEFMKSTFPTHIPNVAFIVSKFNDDRFEGENSDFTRMLKALAQIKNTWTDYNLSNTILLLTNSSKVHSDSENIELKISKFKTAFSDVFPSCLDVPTVLVDNSKKNGMLHLFNKLVEVSNEKGDFGLQIFLESITSNTVKHPICMKYTPLSEIKINRRKVNKVLENLLSTEISRGLSSTDSEYEEDAFIPVFVPYRKSQTELKVIKSFNNISVFTVLVPDTILVLCNRVEITVQKLKVGDKLLNRRLKPVVVTSIKLVHLECEHHSEKIISTSPNFQSKQVGKVFCCPFETDPENCKRGLKFVNGKFRPCPISTDSNFQGFGSSKRVISYLIGLDSFDHSHGTFIADGFLLYFKHDGVVFSAD